MMLARRAYRIQPRATPWESMGNQAIIALKGQPRTRTMSQSLVKNLIHLTFSTKGRAPLLKEDVRTELHKYIKGVFRDWECPAIAVNSVEDHVHALF